MLRLENFMKIREEISATEKRKTNYTSSKSRSRSNIHRRPGSISRNPQGNSIIERIHQSVGNVLRIVTQAEDPKTVHEATQDIHKTLALTMKACRCATNGTLGHYTSGALAFKRDMLMNIPLVSDIIALQNKRQELIDERLLKSNASRISHDFQVGEEVLKKRYLWLSDQLQPSFEGPY